MAIQKHLISTVNDKVISNDSTLIYLEYEDKTGKVNRINNTGEVLNTEILIRLRCEGSPSNWTREYVISPDKDGEERLSIDTAMSVHNFFLERDKEGWRVPDTVSITITETQKNIKEIAG